MKKGISFLIIFLMFLFPSEIYAQMPAVVPAGMSSVSLERIGVVAATAGKVELTTPGQVGRIAESGQAVFMGDEVETDAQGHLQILLLDETVFTIGPNSAIIIDEFVYDPKTHDGKMKASITQGIFRYVSGRIAAKKPSNVTLKLPTATIGIRGTIIAGEANAQGSMVMLLGPGANNNAGATIGSFTLEGTTGSGQGVEREVSRTGFGVQVDQAGGVSGVFQVPAPEVARLTTGLMGPGGQVGDHNKQPGQPGQPQGQGQNQGQRDEKPQSSGLLKGESAGKVAGDPQFPRPPGPPPVWMPRPEDIIRPEDANPEQLVMVPNAVTRMVELIELTRGLTGIYHYSGSGWFKNESNGLSFQCDIDFSNKSIGGGNSHVNVAAGGYSDQASLPARFYGNKSGDAVFNWVNLQGSNSGVFNSIDVKLINGTTVVAHQASVNVSYVHGGEGPATGTGSGQGSRSPGASP